MACGYSTAHGDLGLALAVPAEIVGVGLPWFLLCSALWTSVLAGAGYILGSHRGLVVAWLLQFGGARPHRGGTDLCVRERLGHHGTWG